MTDLMDKLPESYWKSVVQSLSDSEDAYWLTTVLPNYECDCGHKFQAHQGHTVMVKADGTSATNPTHCSCCYTCKEFRMKKAATGVVLK